MDLLLVLILAFPGAPIDSTLVLCLCGQATDLVPPSHFAFPEALQARVWLGFFPPSEMGLLLYSSS
jgi:hypothetical protein